MKRDENKKMSAANNSLDKKAAPAKKAVAKKAASAKKATAAKITDDKKATDFLKNDLPKNSIKDNPNVNKCNSGLCSVRNLLTSEMYWNLPNAKYEYLHCTKKEINQLNSQKLKYGFSCWDFVGVTHSEFYSCLHHSTPTTVRL